MGTAIAADVQCGLKLGLGSSAALKLGVGLPSLLDATLMLDAGSFATTNLGIGFRGVSLGLALHAPLARNVVGHLTLSGMRPWSKPDSAPDFGFAGGLGLEFTDLWR